PEHCSSSRAGTRCIGCHRSRGPRFVTWGFSPTTPSPVRSVASCSGRTDMDELCLTRSLRSAGPHNEVGAMTHPFVTQFGEAFVGTGAEAAHINTVLGEKGGPVEVS